MRNWLRTALAGVLLGLLTIAVAGAVLAIALSSHPVDAAQVIGTILAVVVFAGSTVAVIWRLQRPELQQLSTADEFARDARGGRPQRLQDMTLADLGVQTPRDSSQMPQPQLPYAPRHKLDPQLEDALRTHRFVVVRGPSAAGKSRSTAQAARKVMGQRRVIVPIYRRDALATLLSAGVVTKGTVIWLSDLERHIDSGLDAELASRLLAIDDLRIVATIRDSEYRRLAPSGDLRPQGRDVIELAMREGRLLTFENWDDTDRLSAASQYKPFRQEVASALTGGQGLGEYLVVGPEMVERLDCADNPGGLALVRAAADWYRAGMSRPAPLPLVQRLYPAYLPADDAALLKNFDDSLAWACQSISGARTVSQLTETGDLVVHPYVLDHWLRHPPGAMTEHIWDVISDAIASDLADLTSAASAAVERHGNLRAAERLMDRARQLSETPSRASEGASIARRQPQRRAIRWAIGRAMHQIGGYAERRKSVSWAEFWYRAGAVRGYRQSMVDLGRILENRGRFDEAETWYRAANIRGRPGDE